MPDNWGAPKNAIALVGLLISIVANIYQYYSGERKLSFEKEKWTQEYNLEKSKWELEIEKWKAKVNEQDELKVDKKKLEAELQDVKEAIKIWDDAIFDHNQKLTLMKNSLRTETNKFKIETLKKNIAAREDAISVSKGERDRANNRKIELEKLLFK